MKKTKKDLSPKTNNSKNLNLIINSDNYKLAYEDIDLLSRNEMRGVRMLLEITKPDLILEEKKNSFNHNNFWRRKYCRRIKNKRENRRYKKVN